MSYAGFLIAQKLWDHVDVTVIDKRDHFELITCSFKMMFEHDKVDECLTLNEKTAQAFKKITYKQGTLSKVNKKTNTIEVTNVETGTPERVDFDILVICTGFQYPGMIRGEHLSLEKRKLDAESY